MEDFRNTPILSDEEVNQQVNRIINSRLSSLDRGLTLHSIMGFIDLTTLEGADTNEKVIAMCNKGTQSVSSRNEWFCF